MKKAASDAKAKLRWLPLRRARLPRAAQILPYLRRIDKNQWYTNFGKLNTAFESRLAAHFGVEPQNLATFANATLALTASLHAQGVKAGQYCLMPSFTFIATPASVIAAHLEPYFLDVDRSSWALEPEIVERALARGLTNVGAVMPVSPFGAPLDAKAWDAFSKRTGIPVVLDAAWAFDSLHAGANLAVVSLHATKVMGIGEGGLIVSRLPKTVATARKLSNFGFGESHMSELPSGNSKMSEYAAAMGLAALDEWPKRRAALISVSANYRKALHGIPGVRLMDWFGKHAVATCPVQMTSPIGVREIDLLRQRGVEGRLWWGQPCHVHPAYSRYKRDLLTNTEWLAGRVLCLPFYAELTKSDVLRVRDAVAEI